VSDSSRTLLLCGPLEPYSFSLIAQAQKISDSTVALFVAPQLDFAAIPQNGEERILLALTEPLHFALPDAGFDLVISSWTLHGCAEPGAHLREIVRVLKPGGALLLMDGLDAPALAGSDAWLNVYRLMLEIDQALTQKPRSLLSPSEIIELLHSVGFTQVQANKLPAEAMALLPEEAAALSRRAMALLEQHYRKALTRIPGGEKRWGRRLRELVENLRSGTAEGLPYLAAHSQKPKAAELEEALSAAKKSRRKIASLTEGYVVADENVRYSLRFRELPDEFKPREKLILHGPAALKNQELLAVLLVSGTTKENVLELSRRLIQEYGSRAIAQERSVRRLQETLGIGMNKACQIVAAFELGRRFFEEPFKKSPTILAADDAFEYLRDMGKFTKEHFRGLYLNTRNRVIRDEIISIGTLNMSVVHPREVFLPAVEFSAAAIILAHNHPSGDPTPSEEDLDITHQMVEAGKVMGIEVFDHIIIGEDAYVSLQQEGKLK